MPMILVTGVLACQMLAKFMLLLNIEFNEPQMKQILAESGFSRLYRFAGTVSDRT